MNLFFINTSQRHSVRQVGLADADRQRAERLSPLGARSSTPPGATPILVTNTAAGGKLVMMHHFDPERALELIERERITIFGGVPTMVMQVLDSPDFARRDTSSVRSVSYGGAPAPPISSAGSASTSPSASPPTATA